MIEYNDHVEVTTGDHKGKTGQVLQVLNLNVFGSVWDMMSPPKYELTIKLSSNEIIKISDKDVRKLP